MSINKIDTIKKLCKNIYKMADKRNIIAPIVEELIVPITEFFEKYMLKNKKFFTNIHIYFFNNGFLYISLIEYKSETDQVFFRWAKVQGSVCEYGDPQTLFSNSLVESRLQMPITAEQYIQLDLNEKLPFPYLTVPKRFNCLNFHIYHDTQILLHLLEEYKLIQKNTTKRLPDKEMFDTSTFPEKNINLPLIDAHTYGQFYIFDYDLYQFQRNLQLPIQIRTLFLQYTNWCSFVSIVYHESTNIPLDYALRPCPYLFQYIPRSIYSSKELVELGVKRMQKISSDGHYSKNIVNKMTTFEIRKICDLYITDIPKKTSRKILIKLLLEEPTGIRMDDWLEIYKIKN